MPALESGDALLGKSSAPAGHKTTAAVDALGHFFLRSWSGVTLHLYEILMPVMLLFTALTGACHRPSWRHE
jgi:hypothetical protein